MLRSDRLIHKPPRKPSDRAEPLAGRGELSSPGPIPRDLFSFTGLQPTPEKRGRVRTRDHLDVDGTGLFTRRQRFRHPRRLKASRQALSPLR